MQTTGQTILITRGKIQRLIQKCFDANEWAFLWADEGFKQQALCAETLAAMEEVSQHGALLLLRRDFPRKETYASHEARGTNFRRGVPQSHHLPNSHLLG